MLVYVVTAHKWGSLESHSYVCGVFDNREDAELLAKKEMYWKVGKYDCMVTTMEMNNTSVLNKGKSEHEWIKMDYSDNFETIINEEYAKSLYNTF